MAGILVGDEECPIQDIVTVFGSPFMSTITILKWRSFARRLHTPLHVVKKHQLDLQLDKISHVDVIEELLLEWRSRASENANLGELLKLIVEHFQWQELIDFLQTKIRQYAESWTDLDPYSQDVILGSTIIFQGEEHTLKSFSSKIPNEKLYAILKNTLSNELFRNFFQKRILHLDAFVSMQQNPCYIQRNLVLRRNLNPKIFAVDSHDIFIFEGLQHHQLTNLVQPQSTDVSGNQVNGLSVRFILLEIDNDFAAIARITKQPLHRINYSKNKFVWEGSVGSLRLIRSFLFDDCEEFSETSFVTEKLSVFNTRPTLICSSPGMGKSVLLSNLACEVKKYFPERIVLYLDLGIIFNNKTITDVKGNVNFVEQTLVMATSNNSLGNGILMELIRNVNINFEVFLDGFDEIPFDVLEQAKEFIKVLLEYKHMRIFITSRPHLRNELEDSVECMSYNLSPFTHEDQKKFLCEFWEMSIDAKTQKNFEKFAEMILASLTPINGEDSAINFAGIPLQCFMLAQVYFNDARRHANRNHSGDNELRNTTKSLFELYVHFMDFKLQNCQKTGGKDNLQIFHWNEALGVLFPENPYALIMRATLNEKLKAACLTEENILSVGIMEKYNTNLQFVHRTFAEYLIAEFIVQNVILNPLVDKGVLSEFVYESILDVRFSTEGVAIKDYIAKILKTSLNGFLQSQRQSYKKLAHILLTFPKVLNLYREAELETILDLWIQQSGTSATVDTFLRALTNLGWNDAADDLVKSVYVGKLRLQHPTICMFLNEHLAKHKSGACIYNKDNFTMNYSCPNSTTSFLYRVSTCSGQQYRYLIQLLVRVCSENVKMINLVHMKHKPCHDFILYATRCNDVEFFEYCCNVVKAVSGLEFPNVKFWINQLNDTRFEHTPLHESVVQGNYKLVEYFTNLYEEKLKTMPNVWQLCLFNSSKDSRHVVNSKVKILFLLGSINLLNDFIEINSTFPSSVHVDLFIAFCNIVGYVPRSSNLELIAQKVLASVSSYSETDVLVSWFLSKNMAEMLLLLFDGKRSILEYTLSYNLVNTKTLEKIYKSHPFNLGDLLSGTIMYLRGDELVEAIVELSADVNLIDSCRQTLLHKAAYLRDINIIRYLLAAGAEANFTDTNGCTPLHLVFYDNGMSETNIFVHDCVKILIENDADINAKTKKEVTPYAYALLQKEKLSIEDRTIEFIENEIHLSRNTISDYSMEAENVVHLENRRNTRCIIV